MNLTIRNILNKIRAGYTHKHIMLDDLCKILDIGKSGLYSKLNGRTSFSINELIVICKYYKLSLDYFVYEDKLEELPYSFLADTIRLGNETAEQYVTNWFNHLSQIDKIPQLELYYLANEIPIFYYFRNPRLLGLKLFIWSKLGNDKITESINYYAEHPTINVFSKHLSERYASRNTVEIWNPNMFNELLQQVRFFRSEIKQQDDGLLQRLKADLINVVDQMARSTETGLKKMNNPSEEAGELTIYLNELRFSNEMILILSEKQSVIYQQYDVPNYLRSHDPRICDHSKGYIDTVMSQSTMISMSARQKATDLIHHFRNEIEEKWPE